MAFVPTPHRFVARANQKEPEGRFGDDGSLPGNRFLEVREFPDLRGAFKLLTACHKLAQSSSSLSANPCYQEQTHRGS